MISPCQEPSPEFKWTPRDFSDKVNLCRATPLPTWRCGLHGQHHFHLKR